MRSIRLQFAAPGGYLPTQRLFNLQQTVCQPHGATKVANPRGIELPSHELLALVSVACRLVHMERQHFLPTAGAEP